MKIERTKFLDAVIERTETDRADCTAKGVRDRTTDSLKQKPKRVGRMTHGDILRERWLRHPIGMLFADEDQ